MWRFPLMLTIGVVLGLPASADLVITEIMYNPRSPEGRWPDRDDPADEGEPARTEWVEIHNTGADPVEVAGYHLADEDGRTTGLPEGAVINAGQTIVLIPGDCAVSEFHQAWGEGITVWQLQQWGRGGLNNLANSPSETNELLELRDPEGEAIDQVNYDDEGAWPRDAPAGPSIYLSRNAFDPISNDAGANWTRAEPGIDGAKTCAETEHFTGQDVGSPGVLPPKIDDTDPVPMPDPAD